METASTSCEPDPVMKQQFYIELQKNRSTAGRNAVFLTDERYEELVDEVKIAKNAPKKVPRHYWLLNKYDVLVVEDKPKLIKPLTDDEKLQFYVPDSELFDVIYNVHISINHCGRDRLIKELSPKYKNITRHDIELFLQLCIPCQHKLKGNKKGLARPFVCTEVNSRCQVNLIDFRSHPDEDDNKYILVYQDYLTKFVVLKALKTKNADEVAFKLVDIFTLIGAPSILQSNIGPEFSSQVVLSLKKYWSQLKIVYGKPYHSRDQKRAEWDNQDIQNMLTAWMREENSTQWSTALRFIQLMKNQSYHTAIKMSPYEALFGCRVKIGLNTSNLPQEMLEDIKSEEELSEIVKLTDEPNAYTRDQEEEDETSTAISVELSQAQCEKIKTEPVEPTTSPADESKPDLSSLIDDKTNLSLNMNNKNANSSLDFCNPSPLSSELLLQTPVNNNELHSSLFSYSPTENQITHELAQAEMEIHRRTLLMNEHYNRKVRREVQKDVLASNIYPNTFPMTSPQTNPTEDLHPNLQIQTKKNLATGWDYWSDLEYNFSNY